MHDEKWMRTQLSRAVKYSNIIGNYWGVKMTVLRTPKTFRFHLLCSRFKIWPKCFTMTLPLFALLFLNDSKRRAFFGLFVCFVFVRYFILSQRQIYKIVLCERSFCRLKQQFGWINVLSILFNFVLEKTHFCKLLLENWLVIRWKC